jgi:hypothetical protein
MARWRAEYDWPRWREVLETSLDEEAFGQRLQEASRRGRPLGGEEFTEKLERRCGRRLRPLPLGRPRKSGATETTQMGLGLVFECAVLEFPGVTCHLLAGPQAPWVLRSVVIRLGNRSTDPIFFFKGSRKPI